MKNVPIKFRGIVIYGQPPHIKKGDVVYGDLFHVSNFFHGDFIDIVDVEKNIHCIVDPDSVAQLIGYDVDGNEVYEGDLLTLEDYDYIADIRPVVYSTDRETFRPNQDFSEYRLKEKNNE